MVSFALIAKAHVVVPTTAFFFNSQYMSAQPLPIGASGMDIDVIKITLLSRKPLRFTGKV